MKYCIFRHSHWKCRLLALWNSSKTTQSGLKELWSFWSGAQLCGKKLIKKDGHNSVVVFHQNRLSFGLSAIRLVSHLVRWSYIRLGSLFSGWSHHWYGLSWKWSREQSRPLPPPPPLKISRQASVQWVCMVLVGKMVDTFASLLLLCVPSFLLLS